MQIVFISVFCSGKWQNPIRLLKWEYMSYCDCSELRDDVASTAGHLHLLSKFIKLSLSAQALAYRCSREKTKTSQNWTPMDVWTTSPRCYSSMQPLFYNFPFGHIACMVYHIHAMIKETVNLEDPALPHSKSTTEMSYHLSPLPGWVPCWRHLRLEMKREWTLISVHQSPYKQTHSSETIQTFIGQHQEGNAEGKEQQGGTNFLW